AVRAIRHIETVSSALSVAGSVAAMRHQPIQAATLWAAADRYRERVHLAEDPNVERLRAKWQPQALAEARDANSWTTGQTAGAELSLEEALDLAREATKSKEPDPPAEPAAIPPGRQTRYTRPCSRRVACSRRRCSQPGTAD